MLERIVLSLALVYSPAEECAEFCEHIVNSILTASLRSPGLWECIINRFICTRADELSRFCITSKESMFLAQECLKFPKDIWSNNIEGQTELLGHIDTPVKFKSLQVSVNHTEVTGTYIREFPCLEEKVKIFKERRTALLLLDYYWIQ